MAIYFFDTSALVKRYAPEEGTRWVQSLTDPASSNRIYISRITGAEVIAAFRRNVRDGDTTVADAVKVTADFRYDFNNQYLLIEISDLVVTRAMTLIETHPLKGYDGIQLAAALAVNAALLPIDIPVVGGSPLILVSADNQLNRAAAAEGLGVENPQSHPRPHDKANP